jgi:hypothetical protein
MRSAMAIALEIERNLLPVAQTAHARAFDGGNVHEHILAAAIGRDEAEALGHIEKLYCADSHCRLLHKNGPRGPSTADIEIEGNSKHPARTRRIRA